MDELRRHAYSRSAFYRRFHRGFEDRPLAELPVLTKAELMTAFDDPNPVMFFEHKAMYRSITGAVPEQPYGIPIGKANIAPAMGICSSPSITTVLCALVVRYRAFLFMSPV